MGFNLAIADPDVYRGSNGKPDGFRYYEYILVYVDDVLIISHSPQAHLERKTICELNPSRIGPPKWYLGADVDKVLRPVDLTGQEYWSFSEYTYVKNAVHNVTLMLAEEERELRSTANTPFPRTNYRPEIDMSDECDDEQGSRYSQLVGVL
jgi:hypothetical protein